MKTLKIFSFGILLSSGLALAADNTPIYVGVIEPWNLRVMGETNPTAYMVRNAFKFENGAWSAMPSNAPDDRALTTLTRDYPKNVEWTIAFDGTSREKFKSQRPDAWAYYADVGFYQPDPTTPIKLITKNAERFSYWTGQPPFRPLVVISAPNSKDPDHWKPWNPNAAELKRLIAPFRVQVGPVAFTCGEKETLNYPDSAVVVESAYRSDKNDSVAGLRIDPKLLKCDDMPNANWGTQWFATHKTQSKYIGSEMTVIDAGDYDNDGSSEVILLRSEENLDAYVLLTNRLSKKIEFGWNYH